MHPVEISTVIAHISVIPAEIDVVADHVGNGVELAFGFQRIEICSRRSPAGVELLHNCVQLPAILVHVGGILEHGDLVLDAPAKDRRMMDVLENQFTQLLFGVFHQGLALGHLEHRHLCPGKKAQLVAAVIGSLRMLIMRQTHGVGADLFNQRKIAMDLFFADRAENPGEILMFGHTPELIRPSVEQQTAVGRHFDAPEARAQFNRILHRAAN